LLPLARRLTQPEHDYESFPKTNRSPPFLRWTVGSAKPKKGKTDGAVITVNIAKLDPASGGMVCVDLSGDKRDSDTLPPSLSPADWVGTCCGLAWQASAFPKELATRKPGTHSHTIEALLTPPQKTNRNAATQDANCTTFPNLCESDAACGIALQTKEYKKVQGEPKSRVAARPTVGLDCRSRHSPVALAKEEACAQLLLTALSGSSFSRQQATEHPPQSSNCGAHSVLLNL
jgi:hypothetical protein